MTNTKPKLLLVEDDQDMIDALLMKAEGGPWEITVAKSVTEAEAALKNNPAFDAIVTDFELPDGNGYAVKAFAGIMRAILAPIYLHSSRDDVKLDGFTGSFQKLGKPIQKFLKTGAI